MRLPDQRARPLLSGVGEESSVQQRPPTMATQQSTSERMAIVMSSHLLLTRTTYRGTTQFCGAWRAQQPGVTSAAPSICDAPQLHGLPQAAWGLAGAQLAAAQSPHRARSTSARSAAGMIPACSEFARNGYLLRSRCMAPVSAVRGLRHCHQQNWQEVSILFTTAAACRAALHLQEKDAVGDPDSACGKVEGHKSCLTQGAGAWHAPHPLCPVWPSKLVDDQRPQGISKLCSGNSSNSEVLWL